MMVVDNRAIFHSIFFTLNRIKISRIHDHTRQPSVNIIFIFNSDSNNLYNGFSISVYKIITRARIRMQAVIFRMHLFFTRVHNLHVIEGRRLLVRLFFQNVITLFTIILYIYKSIYDVRARWQLKGNTAVYTTL